MYNETNNPPELYHHGIMGMHWGIRRYQPYRKGEKVKGGKEVGKATKVEQRNETTKVTKQNSEDYGKRYEDELNRVKAGGVDKNIDNLIKKAKEKSENYKKDRTYQRYLADAKATNELDTALKDYMRSKGYSRHSPKEITEGIKKSANEYNSAKKSYDDATAKLDKMFNGSYYDNYYKKEFRELVNGEQASKLRSQKYAAERAMAQAKRSIEFWEKEPMEHAMKSNNELYHHGVLGMHWGIRRYQPYRKGDKVKGGKEVGQATKVEQRSLADRVKKTVANLNKLSKEIHKGKIEKAEYKQKMAELKDARKEVKRARRRELEERIRERVRENREEQRAQRMEEEERKARNLETAGKIVNGAAQIGTLLYSAYQLKKGMESRGLLGGRNESESSSTSTSSSSSSSPRPLTYTRSGSGTSSSSSSNTPRSLRQEGNESRKRTIQNNLGEAIRKLSAKTNKNDEDRYVLLSLRALQRRVDDASTDGNDFDGEHMGHFANLRPDDFIRRQRAINHEDTSDYLAHYAAIGSDFLCHRGIIKQFK